MGHRIIRNQNGLSLIETLVTLSIVAIISLAIAQMANDSMNAMNYSESRFEELELSRQIQMYLATKSSCEKNFTNKFMTPLDPKKYGYLNGYLNRSVNGLIHGANGLERKLFGISNFATMVDNNGNKIVSTGDVVGNRSLKITSLDFTVDPQDWNAYLAAKSAIEPGSKGAITKANLQISADRLKTSFGGKNFSRSFPVNVYIDATGKINGCYTDADALAEQAVTIIDNEITQIVNNTTTNNTTINNSNTTVNNTVVNPSPGAATPAPTATPDPCARGVRKPLRLRLWCFFHRHDRYRQTSTSP